MLLQWAPIFGLMALVLPTASFAESFEIPAQLQILSSGHLSKIVSKPQIKGDTFPLPEPPLDPAHQGASMVWCSGYEECDLWHLDAPGWKALGDPPGSAGYQFSGETNFDTRCKVTLKPKVIRASCKDASQFVFGSLDSTGLIWQLLLNNGDRYCAQSGPQTNAIVVKDEFDFWRAIRADAPMGCAIVDPN